MPKTGDGLINDKLRVLNGSGKLVGLAQIGAWPVYKVAGELHERLWEEKLEEEEEKGKKT